MNNYLKWILPAISFFTLAGCATTHHEQQPIASQKPSTTIENRVNALSTLQNWDLKGKIAIRSPKDAYSANWQWHQDKQNYTISLIGPLGSNAIQLTGSPGSVLLERSDGKKFKSTRPETLLEQQLGWRLPVSSLYYWVRGLPVPGVSLQKQLDASSRLSVLMQQGWRIEYSRYTTVNGMDLPGKITLNNATLNVKMIINQWRV